MKPDHGISADDIAEFQAKLISDAIESAYIWSCMAQGEHKDELREEVMEKLVACYHFSIWSERAYPHPEPEYEPFEDD
jgi:hypothetical protein